MTPTASAARASHASASSLRDRLKDPSLLREHCFIDGAWVGTPSFAINNPATGAELAKIPQMSAADATHAVEAAERAFPGWAKHTAKQRSNILRKWYELIVANREDLALILTSEQGKPLAEALGEIDISGAYVEFFAEEARRVYGETIPTQRPDARLLAIKQPIGVCGAITPWNFPSSMITRKVSPALAAGCTVVLKPANETPLSALALAALAEKAGVPSSTVRLTEHSRSCDLRTASGRMARALSPASPSGNLTRNVTTRSVRWLPSPSRTFSPSTVTSNESGSARREVRMSTSTAVQPPIAASSRSTGVNSVPCPVPMVIWPPRSLCTVYRLFSMRSIRTLR